MFAGRSIRHREEEVEIGIERNGNLHFSDGEVLVPTVDAGTTAILGDLSLNTLALEIGAGSEIALGERVFARKAGEVAATEAVEVSGWERTPVETTLLFWCANVVGIRRIAERFGISPASSGSLLQEESSRQSGSKEGFHIGKVRTSV